MLSVPPENRIVQWPTTARCDAAVVVGELSVTVGRQDADGFVATNGWWSDLDGTPKRTAVVSVLVVLVPEPMSARLWSTHCDAGCSGMERDGRNDEDEED